MATESEICKDWLKEFPLLKRFKSGRKLLRLEGPIVLGIELEKFSSKEYRPKFVALNLLSNFPVFGISRTLATKRLPQLSIAYSKHESAFQEAVGIMKDNFPFLSGPITSQVLVETYRSEVKLVLRDWLLDQADKALKRRKAARKNYHGSELREHDEAMARRLIEEGLKKTRLSRKELRTLPKGDARKARIAATVRATTTVPLQWLADQLHMGTTSNISHACRHHARASKE